MNARIVGLTGIVGVVVLLTGCETYKPYSNPGTPLPKLKNVAILVPPNSKEKLKRADDIASVLQKRGIESVIVPAGAVVPKGVDGYFTYTDHWEWDLTMYLAELDIELHEAQTSRLLASARYKQGFLHRYPDPIEIVDSLIGQILGEPPPAPRPQAQSRQNRELIKR